MSLGAIPLGSLAVPKGLVGGPFGSSLVNNDYTNDGVPVIRGTNLSFGKFIGGANVFVSEEKVAEDLSRNTAAPGDLVFTQRGTLGQVAIVPTGRFSEYVISQSQMRLRVNPTVASAEYLYYACSSSKFLKQISDHAIATGVPHINLGILNRLTVPLHELPEQRAIAQVLGALDDKIAANTKLAATGEQLMHASYRRMMGTVPAETRVVESLVERISAPHKVTKSDVQAAGDTPVFDQSETGLLGYVSNMPSFMADQENPVLFFGDHTCKLRISVRNFALGPNTIPFKARELPEIVLFCALQGVQQHEEYKRHWLNLTKKEIRVPGTADAEFFRTTFSGVPSLLQNRELENRALAATRDALLPQLMSGKLRVKDAEKVLENVV